MGGCNCAQQQSAMTLHIVGKVKSEHSSKSEIRICMGESKTGDWKPKTEQKRSQPNRTVTLHANGSYSRNRTAFKVLCVRTGLQIMMHIAWDGAHGVS